MGCFGTTWKVLTRRKKIFTAQNEPSQLSRVLTAFDLTALGVGSTLGVGVYVIAGKVAKEAGPAVVLSFFIAAVASVFAGLCYAEFGARTPKAGSAYIYSYVCVGEFIAFVIGWNLILEYVIGSASVARGLSGYLDTMINNTLQNAFIDIAPINVSFMAEYFDFFAFGISVLLAVALAFGMKTSSMINNVITGLNMCVVIFVVIVGSIKSDTSNWNIQPNNTNTTEDVGKGGFFPFGIESVIKGAATCFYGFVGFDCIATTGEEVRNPKRAIPISIILALLIIFLSYFSTSTVVTLMVPYYAQDINAPIPHAFEEVGYDWAKWVVAIGGMFGLCASLFGAMFPLPRILYAMARDSLIFKFLGTVNERFQSPVTGTILSGILTGLMAALFKLDQLVDMMSIGTLMAYTIVAASVLILRYERDCKNEDVQSGSEGEDDVYTEDREPVVTYTRNVESLNSDDTELIIDDSVKCTEVFGQLFKGGQHPTIFSEKVAGILVFIFCVLSIGIGLCIKYSKNELANGEVWAITLISIIVLFAVLSIILLAIQPTSRAELSFKVPLVPLVPALSILINLYLMLMLDVMTWIRFAVWMAVGLPIYYFSMIKPAAIKSAKTPRSLEIYNKHKKQNGCDNPTFVFDDDVLSSNGNYKTKPRAPLPPLPVINIIDTEKENDDFSNNNNSVAVFVAYSCDSPVSLEANVVSLPVCYSVLETVKDEKIEEEKIVQSEAPLIVEDEVKIENNELELKIDDVETKREDEVKIEKIEDVEIKLEPVPDTEEDNKNVTEEKTNFPQVNLRPVSRPSLSKESINNFAVPKVELRPVTDVPNKKRPKFNSTAEAPAKKPIQKRVESFNDVKLKPVGRQYWQDFEVEVPKPPPMVTEEIPEPPPIKDIDPEDLKNTLVRPSSFQLKNAKLKPVVRRKSSKKSSDPLRPSASELRNVHLKPTLRKKPKDNILPENDVSGVFNEGFVTNTRKLSDFKHKLENILVVLPGTQNNNVYANNTNSTNINMEQIREGVDDDNIDRTNASKTLFQFLQKQHENAN